MKIKAILVILAFISCWTAVGQGLHFRGSEYPIEERTSMNIPLRKAFADSLVIRFDIAFSRERDNGYIFRIGRIPDENNIGGICLFMDSMGEEYQFRVIWEGHRFISDMSISRSDVVEGEWLPVRFVLTPKKDSVYLQIGRHGVGGTMDLQGTVNSILCLGKNEYRIDVPSFDMRNLSVKMDQKVAAFPLEEDSGNTASSSLPGYKAKISNPEWLNRDRLRWKKRFSQSSAQFLTCGYDDSRHEIYLISRDSLHRIPLGKGMEFHEKTSTPNPLHTFLGASFPQDGGYYCYEAYYGDEVPLEYPTLAFLDSSLTWNILSSGQFPTQLHHHNLISDTLRHRHYLYGGFGNRLYNGRFYCLDDSGHWHPAPELTGDEVWPRYFASAGWDSVYDKIYLFGGMGNQSGDHIVGRQYLYDFFVIDPETFEAEKVWTLPKQKINKVPVRNMVLPGDSYFYTLMYPESYTETELQLYRFSLQDGQMSLYADAIPMNSDRILTNANLYYDTQLQILIALLEESTNDIDSRVTVYTLSFPPLKRNLSTVTRERIRKGTVLLFALLLVGMTLYLIKRKIRHSRRLKASIPAAALQPLKPVANSLSLFGVFAAYDAEGNEISAEFPEKIRQLLLLILLGMKDGVSSKNLRSLLWPDKDEMHAKNLRGVTMNKLRKALSLMDGVSIEFKDGHFILQYREPFSCDYLRFQQILQSEQPDMDTLIRLLSRGKFLLGETDPMFDYMKDSFDRQVQPVMQREMKRRVGMKDYNNAILCADILFLVDPLDDEALAGKIRALQLLGHEDDARTCYQQFISRYKREYAEEYGTAYDSLSI